MRTITEKRMKNTTTMTESDLPAIKQAAFAAELSRRDAVRQRALVANSLEDTAYRINSIARILGGYVNPGYLPITTAVRSNIPCAVGEFLNATSMWYPKLSHKCDFCRFAETILSTDSPEDIESNCHYKHI